jgi:bacterioferritin-associated ferredoxin
LRGCARLVTVKEILACSLPENSRNAADEPRLQVCYCFHITRRKLLNFIRQNRPCVPSQLSECGGAGTGCGWCIPFLKQLHQQAVAGGTTDLEQLTPEEYEQRRARYIREGKGKPPAGAAPLPPPEETGA